MIGMGSFGPVWKIQRTQCKNFFAMKVMKKSEVIRLNCIDSIMNELTLLSTM
jgi:serine/threonine protein kinase